jgi:hypothetical protein
MTPTWLVRLNDFLIWLNPVLGLVAGVLAVMVIGAAAERLPMRAAQLPAQTARPVQRSAALTCPRTALPPEWRDMLLHD